MEQYTTIITAVSVATLLFWFFLHQLYTKQYKFFLKSFLDSNNNITILYDEDKITSINSVGLEFFGFKSVKDFNARHVSLSNLFLEGEGCIDKHTYGKKWFESLKMNNKRDAKVKLFSEEDQMVYYFQIEASKLKFTKQYLLSFNNITALEQEKTNIKKLAEYDALTNIYNRVKLNEVLDGLIYRANRYDLKFSIILLDIDHFKAINDTYGHNIGDKVLIELSRLINMSLRESDTFARWGGEEFMIVSESSSRQQASKLASRLCKEVSEYPFHMVGKITCSFGVTEFKVGDKPSLLFERVDKALYEAKDNGRNQVVTK